MRAPPPRLMLTALAWLGAISPALAAGRTANPALTAADTAMMAAVANQLNTAPRVRLGDEGAWNNADTGTAGTVRVVGFGRAGAAPCHMLRYATSFGRRATPTAYTVNWCRTPAGWRQQAASARPAPRPAVRTGSRHPNRHP